MNAFMRPEANVVFLPVELECRRIYDDRGDLEAPLYLDPVLWSDDGKAVPPAGIVWTIWNGSWWLEDARSGRRIMTWYYRCRGPNAANAIKTPIEPVESRVDPSGIHVGDVFEFGTIHHTYSRRRSWRQRYVVLEVGADRLVVVEMPTLAQALRLGNAVKDRLAHDPDRFRRRREAWEEALHPRTIEEDVDDAAIEDVFL